MKSWMNGGTKMTRFFILIDGESFGTYPKELNNKVQLVSADNARELSRDKYKPTIPEVFL